MTNEEALELLKHSIIDNLVGKTDIKRIEAKTNVIKALEKADKYKWHDLRKNPDDLPSEANNEEWFMCVLENHIYDTQYPYFQYNSDSKEFGVWNYICKGFRDYDLRFDNIDSMEYEKVIAWKRIELF